MDNENLSRTIQIIEAYTKVMKVAIAYKDQDITAQVAMEQIVYLLMDTELEQKND